MILSGKELSDRIRAELATEVAEFPQKYGRAPQLAVIMVGDNPASATYVRNKARACEKTGITNNTIHLPESTSQEELLDCIKWLNEADDVDGILVQLPLPKQIDEGAVLEAISREKDVDGFHPMNVAELWTSRSEPAHCVPCTPRGILRLLKSANVEIAGKRAVVIGRSNIVGLPTAKLLLNENATVTICHSRTQNLAEVTREADILVVAIGKANYITADMVKPGAVVIDAGINSVPVENPEPGAKNYKIVGDVDFAAVEPIASLITPVPGGVGPMTICSLMENTIDCFLSRL